MGITCAVFFYTFKISRRIGGLVKALFEKPVIIIRNL